MRGLEHVYGIEPVHAALTAGRRRILQLIIAARPPSHAAVARNSPPSTVPVEDPSTASTNSVSGCRSALIERLARSKGIPVQYSTRMQIDSLCRERVHQGVVLLARSLPEPASVESFLKSSRDTNVKAPLEIRFTCNSPPEAGGAPRRQVAIMLHRVADARNVGAILRTATFLGAAHVILCGSCAPLSPDTSKASAGALEHMFKEHRILSASSPLACIRAMQAAGWIVLAAVGTSDGADDAFISMPAQRNLALGSKVMLVLGNEGTGLSQAIVSECNGSVSVPQAQSAPVRLDSLNVSVAAALLLRGLLETPSLVSLHRHYSGSKDTCIF